MTRTSRRTVVVMGLLFSAVCLLIGGSRGSEKEAQRTPTTKSGTSNVQATERSADKNPDAGLRKIAVQGRCVDDEENPLAGVRVIILRRSEDYRREVIASETISDANGEFKLQDVRTAMLDRGDLMAIGALKGYTTGMVSLAKPQEEVITTEIKLSGNPGTLSGTVRDVHGDPIVGATVYLPCFADLPLPGVRSAVTDKQGRYAISDLNRWDSESTRTFDANTGLGRVTTACYFWLMHPDYPKTMSQNSAVPQTVDVVLHPAAVVEGQVVDEVTSRPAAGVTVSAQGVGRHGWYQTTTDAEGRYRLLMTRDHYNIWAEADDRIAIAIKAIQAERGKTVTNADIRLVQGGFVVGTVFGADGKPISPEKDQRFSVAHHGPARPQTGAAVTSTLVKPDGTYRLRVAPGRNYIYAMNGSGSGVDVVVEDGQEETVNIDLNSKQPEFQRADADRELRRKIYEAAKLEDAEEQKKSLRD